MPAATAVTGSEPSDSAADAAQADAPKRRWLPWVALGLTLVPLLVSAVHLVVAVGNSYHPVGDTAATELITRDIGVHWVSLGPFSRDLWHHPGPALYYVLALPYRLLGSTTAAMNVAALVVNGAAVAGMAIIARRRAGQGAMLVTLLACALLMRSLGPDELQLPWNPYITVLPYGVLVFLTWSLACGDRWALPVAVGVATYLAQTHIGYVALALPLVALGTVWLVVAARTRPIALRAPVLTAVGVGVVMWLPPVVQQLTSEPGNLGLALKWFRYGGRNEEDPAGIAAGWNVVSSQYGLPPEWLLGSRGITGVAEPMSLADPLLPVLLVAVVLAAVALWRWRTPAAAELSVVWALASLVGIVATARTVGAVFEYRLGWTHLLGAIGGIIVAWAGWQAVVRWRPALEHRVLVPAGVAGLAVLAVVTSVTMVDADDSEASARLRELVPDVVEALPPGDGVVVVDGGMTIDGLTYGPGLLLQLERRGVDARLPQGDIALGTHRQHEGGAGRGYLLVVVGARIPSMEATPGATLVAYGGDLTLDELRDDAAAGVTVPDHAATAVFLMAPTSSGPGET